MIGFGFFLAGFITIFISSYHDGSGSGKIIRIRADKDPKHWFILNHRVGGGDYRYDLGRKLDMNVGKYGGAKNIFTM